MYTLTSCAACILLCAYSNKNKALNLAPTQGPHPPYIQQIVTESATSRMQARAAVEIEQHQMRPRPLLFIMCNESTGKYFIGKHSQRPFPRCRLTYTIFDTDLTFVSACGIIHAIHGTSAADACRDWWFVD